MMETALLRSLRLLRDSSEPLAEGEIAERIKEHHVYVGRALERLVHSKVVEKDGESYRYLRTPVNERLAERMFAVYDRIGRRSEGQLVTVGLLAAATQYRYLLRRNALLEVMEAEGFDPVQVNDFLERQVRAGRIGGIRVVLMNRTEARFPAPPAVSLHHVCHLRVEVNEYEEVKQRWHDEGFFIQEEDYLVAGFPPNVADSARQYLQKERAQIAQKIREKAFEWWYGSRTWEQIWSDCSVTIQPVYMTPDRSSGAWRTT